MVQLGREADIHLSESALPGIASAHVIEYLGFPRVKCMRARAGFSFISHSPLRSQEEAIAERSAPFPEFPTRLTFYD